MNEAGIFLEEDRVELTNGEIVEMSPIARRDTACIDRINHLISRHDQKFTKESVSGFP
ncbi:hypothetical protein [Trichormus azollae]|jgi:hypothetical protein|uniref:hypothetical protein n=1 Tax=Trichormus azollae TaxID=1164 RepID=UPI0001957ACE|nr:hypothetical protein [Trichormus azollae]